MDIAFAKSRDCARPDQLYDMEQICLIQKFKMRKYLMKRGGIQNCVLPCLFSSDVTTFFNDAVFLYNLQAPVTCIESLTQPYINVIHKS